ncbi:RNA 2'-phosphotransferase [Alkaliphilus sp. B6464]|uniref:RNA 2'-phosphotransferase n=1 Tax=Alkaliphilus sp. B6464 TaxID=2731219 RepID=UPI001BA85E56|nr:RNA 2'-phosphotransferase [Alkaliphilus sp. B6464]QUH21898.1 RNA 2'-phosphotransferase [Alkaliphilus sp. B6464]
MNNKKVIDLSKKISYVLRHHPEKFGLQLDEDGWVSVKALLTSIKNYDKKWQHITIEDIRFIVDTDDKKRYELLDEKIRAFYGHSVVNKINKVPCGPPEILYHGTTPEAYKSIQNNGLKSMSRQYVHYSLDQDTALMVAKRRTKHPVILLIKANDAYKDGINFYRETSGIYLSENLPSRYIKEAGERE